MLVVFMCCMMKLVEISTGKLIAKPQPREKRNRRYVKIKGKAMTEVGNICVRGMAVSPDSDCNSNHHDSASYLSNASSQEIDFIQDNSDYQWFLDYGYRDGSTNHHTSILSLPESYETNDINYYDAIAKNMDANLAEADMESFKTEDIHALLTNLPPMCTEVTELSQENNRQGESFASVSGSMMAKFDFDSSISPHSSSHGEDSANDSTSMSLYKSELLFSPVKETPMPGPNYSVDSLDCDMMLTCQANKDNYTIAFEGSVYYEDSDYHEADKSENSDVGSAHWSAKLGKRIHNFKVVDASMSQSDSGSFTTWSKLKKRSSDNQLRRHPSGNNNNSSNETSQLGLNECSNKSQSMPNLFKQKLKSLLVSNYLKSQSNSLSDTCTVRRKSVKVFDIQNHVQSSGSGGSFSDMATSVDASSSENMTNKVQPNFNLVKLFMKQKSMSSEGMSTTMDQLSSAENWLASQSGDSNSSEGKLAEQIKNINVSTDQKANEISDRTYDLIAEEPEEEISPSESVEQLSESISKIDSVGNSYERENRLAENKYNINNNNSFSKGTQISKRKSDTDLMNRSIQTSQFSEIINLKNVHKSSTNTNSTQLYRVVEPSFLNKLKKEGEVQKPVYVLYPKYVLPNLDFLNDKQEDLAKVLLMPQEGPSLRAANKKRPFSCNDMEMLKKKGFSHVKDWDSLNFLLPQEYRMILADVPEVSQHIKTNVKKNPTFSQTTKQRRRPVSCDYTNMANQGNTSSSSSTATQPSSGFRGSSTILSDSQNSPAPAKNLNPLFVYRYDSVTSSEASLLATEKQRSITTTPALPMRCANVHEELTPPRPPLPRSILRKEKREASKRYSLYETSEEDITEDLKYKRKSLQEPYFIRRPNRFSETEDEGVDAGASSSSVDEHNECLNATSPTPKKTADYLLSNISTDELVQLEEFLKISGISTSDNEEMTEECLMQLRSYVGKFLSLKINQEGSEHFGGKKSVSFAEKVKVLPKYLECKQFIAPNNSPNVSAFIQQKIYPKTLADIPICEESENSPTYSSPQTTPFHVIKHSTLNTKKTLIDGVTDAIELLINHFSLATNQTELNALGDSSSSLSCAKIALSTLCPALYAILSDGLKPTLESSFGAINNSVWQVVEALAQQGPLTRSLNELVMRINSEDVITEGLVKFNAFIFGLLNVRSLDAWISYLRTRESILKKHYTTESLLIMDHTSGANVRSLLDFLIDAIQPLARLPFQLDLLFEYRQLHLSFKRMDCYQQQLSPSHKHSVSPNFKQWSSPKLGLSACSNRSNSETEDTITEQHLEKRTEKCLPDLLNSSCTIKTKTRSEKERPRSCVENGSLSRPNFKVGDVTVAAKKRWSGISGNSKLYLVYDRLVKEDDEEYTDSLENNAHVKPEEKTENSNESVPSLHEDGGPESLDSNFSDEKPINEKRFKKLQQKWEMLSGRESNDSPPLSPISTPTKSKIPRPIISPIKASGIPVLLSPTAKQSGKLIKKLINPSFTHTTKINNTKTGIVKKPTISSRTSRVDQLESHVEAPRHIQRPSSLPYKTMPPQNGKALNKTPKRASSSSLNRKSLKNSPLPRIVRTLSHRLPSESGHLSYNEGDKLKVVLDVDDKWLLCCRGTQKGLVPKSAVITDLGRF